jgi:predicted nucleotidyltransferase
VDIGRLSIDEAVLAALCEKRGIAELAVFGSALREDFRPDSDVDFLVTWQPGEHKTLLDLVHVTEELRQLFDRPVDLLQRRLVETDHNEYRRDEILGSARTLYAAA